jgi:hypothetical protein
MPVSREIHQITVPECVSRVLEGVPARGNAPNNRGPNAPSFQAGTRLLESLCSVFMMANGTPESSAVT